LEVKMLHWKIKLAVVSVVAASVAGLGGFAGFLFRICGTFW
jgi:hypothetical protein